MLLGYSLINLTSRVIDLYDMINNSDTNFDYLDSKSNSNLSKHLKIQTIYKPKEEKEEKDNYHYKMIHYVKDFLTPDLFSTYGLFRSVILNKNNEVICFSPPKSIPADSFMEKYSLKNLMVVVEEFIEGTMINVFWDKELGIWEIATRNTIGANTYFFKNPNALKKTFRIMFLEACIENNVNITLLNKKCCYSFILQHPENRIVIPFLKPELYLVAVYEIENKINNNDKKEITIKTIFLDQIHPNNINEKDNTNLSNKDLLSYLGIENASIRFPKKIDTNEITYSDLIKLYASMNLPYFIQGLVFYNKLTGERTKIRNPVYEEVRQLRGNQPKLQYQYLSLRHQGKVSEFLKYFPENKKDFSNYRDQVHLFTNNLYTNYISCFIKKEKPISDYPEQYRKHMYQLHQKYLNELRETKGFISNILVKKYVNEMAPALLMYTLNYSLRKRNLELIKYEKEEKAQSFCRL